MLILRSGSIESSTYASTTACSAGVSFSTLKMQSHSATGGELHLPGGSVAALGSVRAFWRAFLSSHFSKAQGTEPNSDANTMIEKTSPNWAGGPHKLPPIPEVVMLATTVVAAPPAAYPTPTVT
jgi:hypothetical protein